MEKRIGGIGSWCAALVIGAVASAGCSAAKPSGGEVSRRSALTTGNGLGENGLTTNGIWSNGIWSNGIWSNGIWSNGIWSNGLTGDAALPGETLRENAYARQLLQYIYSCAMPAATYDTTLDPNDTAPLVCASDADCGIGYACTGERCVIPLRGSGANGSGLGINADGTTWWGQPARGGATDLSTGKWGQCDETCQRWVSACVLARTNAYGVHVQISMRAPAEAPEPIRAALETDATERDSFGRREGAFYGNIFATTPIDAATGGPASSPGTNGPATGPIASTPQYFACAGPDSNIPAITKRFCSSQGDQVVIAVPGTCLPDRSGMGICAGQDADDNGAIHDCHTSEQAQPIATCPVPVDHLDPSCYDEVLTVYLDTPLSVCGNSVCENDNALAIPETATSCPSDCHPESWTKEYSSADPTFGSSYDGGSSSIRYVQLGMFALAPDNSIVLMGRLWDDITINGEVLPLSPGGPGVVITYRPDGTILRGFRFRPSYFDSWPVTVAVAKNGDILLSGDNDQCPHPEQWFVRYSKEGTSLDEWKSGIGCRSGLERGATRLLTLDSAGNAIAAGFLDTRNSHSTPLGIPEPGHAVWVANYSAVDHSVIWSAVFAFEPTPTADKYPLALAVDSADAVLLVYRFGEEYHLQKISSDGTPLWHVDGGLDSAFSAVAVDASGNVYASGYFQQGHDFGRGPESPVTGLPPFLAKYDASGTFQWVSYPQIVCPSWMPGCGGSFAQADGERQRVEGQSINFDDAGNVILGSFGNPVVGGGIDFGKGPFPTYSANNIFLSSHDPMTGATTWAKQVNTVLGGSLSDLKVDTQARVVVGGQFSGSVEVDDHLLVSDRPESAASVNTFLASFNAPSPADHSGPEIAAAIDATGMKFDTTPEDIVVQATGPSGATVFYTQPTALDGEVDGKYAGVTVACAPRPNTTFPLGTTPVTCTASDPVGNTSMAVTFTVTVVDRLGPVFSPMPVVAPVSATGPGTPVPYATPTAIDQVDGPRLVACAPASDSPFAVGATTVNCTSSDNHGNTSSASFTVTVVDRTRPTLTLPGPITATATSVNGAVVTYSATAYDAVDGSITPVCAPPSGATFHLGVTTVNCTATDAAGNQASGSFQVTVQYGWSGFLPPIDPAGGSRFNKGSTVPVKFKLTGKSAGITNLVARLYVAKVVNGVVGPYTLGESTPPCEDGAFRYDASGKQYIFNLSTKKMSTGTWSLRVDLGDGVTRVVQISLK